jgi:hypothetical protein
MHSPRFDQRGLIIPVIHLQVDYVSLFMITPTVRPRSGVSEGDNHIQAANGSTKAELKRTAEMALRHLDY